MVDNGTDESNEHKWLITEQMGQMNTNGEEGSHNDLAMHKHENIPC